MQTYKVEMTGNSFDFGAERYYVLAVEADSEERALELAAEKTGHYTVSNQRHRIVDPSTPVFPGRGDA